MRVFWVLGWENYYPSVDNFVNSFYTYEDALEYIKNVDKLEWRFQNYEIIDISKRLHNETDISELHV
jgi:hypothetical protein